MGIVSISTTHQNHIYIVVYVLKLSKSDKVNNDGYSMMKVHGSSKLLEKIWEKFIGCIYSALLLTTHYMLC